MKIRINKSRESNLSRIKLMLILTAGVLLAVSCGGYGGGGGMSTAPPGGFGLSMPADKATMVSTTPTLSWMASPNATAYEVQINTKVDFTGTMVNDTKNIMALNYTVMPALAPGTTYFWRVIASSIYGTFTSGTSSFTT